MEALIGVYQQGSIKRCAALDLSGNGIGDKGATALARIFDDASLCECLECLDLSRNRILRHRQWASLRDLNLERGRCKAG